MDVSSPTWADLQAIGKVSVQWSARFTIVLPVSQLLHIHPLTLEDILQQEPREKVEDFPNLGYYFISFRTTESQAARERMQREAGLLDSSTTNQGLDEGFIGETNVYLTIFIDGICCVRAAPIHLLLEDSRNLKKFHYTDVSGTASYHLYLRNH